LLRRGGNERVGDFRRDSGALRDNEAMKRGAQVKCRCLFCKEVFYVPLWRLLDLSHGATRRGVACSQQCRVKLFRGWMMLGMKRDKEFQMLKRERENLRRLVRHHDKRAA